MDEDEQEYITTDPEEIKAAFLDAQRLYDLVTEAYLDVNEEVANRADEKIENMTLAALSAAMSIAEVVAAAVTIEWASREDS